MEENSIKQRLISFINIKNISIREFERSCNLSNGYLNSMRKGIGIEKLDNVLNEYPELNRNWLLYGEGEMLLITEQKQEVKEVSQIGSDKIIIDKEVWEMMKAQAESLKAKDEQLSKVISMLEEQMNQKEKVAVQEDNVECVDAAG